MRAYEGRPSNLGVLLVLLDGSGRFGTAAVVPQCRCHGRGIGRTCRTPAFPEAPRAPGRSSARPSLGTATTRYRHPGLRRPADRPAGRTTTWPVAVAAPRDVSAG